jgi:hypothetical protein
MIGSPLFGYLKTGPPSCCDRPQRLSRQQTGPIASPHHTALYSLEYSDDNRDYRSQKGYPVVKIRSQKLTTCQVAADGTNVGLEFLDHTGQAVTVEFPIDQAEAVIMTIPHLLARAVKCQTGSEAARYVFNLEGWSIESTEDKNCLIATLTASRGFEVCFAIPHEACQSLGWNLQRGADEIIDTRAETALAATPARGKLN